MAALEERGTHYVARVRNNAVLKRLALPAIDAVVWDALQDPPPAGEEPRTWVREESYRARSWSRSRRVVQVVVEQPGELIPRCFWLLTSIPSGEMSGEPSWIDGWQSPHGSMRRNESRRVTVTISS